MMKKLLLTIIIYITTLAGAVGLYAQDEATALPQPEKTDFFGLAYNNMFLLLAFIVLTLVVFAAINLIWALIDMQKIKLINDYGPEVVDKANFAGSKSLWATVSDKLWNLVPKEKEQDIDLGHDYDGIRELDNSLPPWWLWLFYICIFWSAVYLWYYHVSDRGVNQETEYINEMAAAEDAKALYLASQANSVDEKSVTVLTDEAAIAEGKDIYVANCLVCHGANGEGGVGPNFADKYWVHGGSINDIFSTIKYGVPEKGMISWKAQLRPAAMQKVASYILTFQGTNPENQKAPEGEIYEPKEGPAENEAPVENGTPIEEAEAKVGE